MGTHIMTDLSAYVTAAEKAFEQAKQLLSDNGWTPRKQGDGCTLEERELPGEPIKAFKVEGIINRPVKECGDKLWNFRQAEWQKLDSDCELFNVVEEGDDLRLVYQLNKIPWPLWQRDVSVLWRRIEEDGAFYFVATSIDNPKVPEYKDKYVRATLTFSLIALVPEGDSKTKFTRVLHVNPAGNIPAAFVNASADRMLQLPGKMEKVFGEM